MTVADVVALYLEHTRHEQTQRTLQGRARHLGAFRAEHGAVPVSQARPFHLQLWLNRQTRWKSDWTKRGACSSIQRAFNWAEKLGLIDRNPFKGVSHREGEPGRPMSGEEYRRALKGSSAPFRRVLVFLRYTGCRPCEVRAVEPRHVDLARGVVILGEHKTLRQQKRRKPRVIVLHPVAGRLLAYLLGVLVPGQTHLFVNARGTPWTRYALATRMKRLRKRLKLPRECKAYGLRHKFGTDAIENGVEIKTLSTLMGHTTCRTTERYVHIEGALLHLGQAVRKAIGDGPK